MLWFKKKAMRQSSILPTQKDIDITDESLYRGVASLASDYYTWLPEENKMKLPLTFKAITGKDYIGKTIIDAVQDLSISQLLILQQMIEKDYKITKH